MSLKTSEVQRNLDSQVRIFGLEVFDLLAALMFGAMMNLIFGKTEIGKILALGFPAIMIVSIHFVKRNRPQGYLIHLIRYRLTPGRYSAGSGSDLEIKMKSSPIKGKK